MKNIHFGDSLSAKLANPPAVDGGFPWLLAFKRGDDFDIKAVSGAMAADQADAMYNYVTDVDMRATLQIGTNDARSSGGAAGKLDNFTRIVSAEVMWLTSNKRLMTDASFTKSAGWVTNAPYTKGVKSGIIGSTIMGTFEGDSLLLGYVSQDTAGGQFTLSVDGVSQGTIVNRGAVNIATLLGRAYAPMLYRQDGFGSGAHSFVITQNQSGKQVYIDCLFEGSNDFPLYVLTIPKMTASGYAAYGGSDAIVASYNAALADIASMAQGYGRNVELIDTAGAVTISTDLLPDGVHYSAVAYAKVGAVLDGIWGAS